MAPPKLTEIVLSDQFGGYVLNIVDLDCAKSIFDSCDVVPTGHAWEAAILKYCTDESLDVSNVEFDPESDLFVAYASNREQLDKIAQVIETFLHKSSVLSRVLESLDLDIEEEFSAEEFIEHLEYNDVDLTKPLDLMFFVEFSERDAVHKACETAYATGYECFLNTASAPYYFAAKIVEIPELNRLNIRIRYFQELALELGGNFESCEDSDSYDLLNIAETDWRQYVPDNGT